VPINKLVAIEGTPLGDAGVEAPSSLDFVRCIATARILMPKSMVRLSAGRTSMSLADQALCFMSGANSIFSGDQLLTTPNPDEDEDSKMFEQLGLHPRPAFLPYKAGNETTRGEHQRSCGSGGCN
jgi:biotin synthase